MPTRCQTNKKWGVLFIGLSLLFTGCSIRDQSSEDTTDPASSEVAAEDTKPTSETKGVTPSTESSETPAHHTPTQANDTLNLEAPLSKVTSFDQTIINLAHSVFSNSEIAFLEELFDSGHEDRIPETALYFLNEPGKLSEVQLDQLPPPHNQPLEDAEATKVSTNINVVPIVTRANSTMQSYDFFKNSTPIDMGAWITQPFYETLSLDLEQNLKVIDDDFSVNLEGQQSYLVQLELQQDAPSLDFTCSTHSQDFETQEHCGFSYSSNHRSAPQESLTYQYQATLASTASKALQLQLNTSLYQVDPSMGEVNSSYRFRVLPYTDDHGNSSELASSFSLASPVDGSFEVVNDQDWFHTQVQPNQWYELTIQRNGYTGELQVVCNPDRLSDCYAEINAETSETRIPVLAKGETIHIQVSMGHSRLIDEQQSHLGGYRLQLTPLDETPSFPEMNLEEWIELSEHQTQYFQLELQQGTSYQVAMKDEDAFPVLRCLSPQCPQPEIPWEPHSFNVNQTQVVWMMVDPFIFHSNEEVSKHTLNGYQSRVQSYTDDHSNSVEAATPIQLGELISGTIENKNDVDIFQIEVEGSSGYELTWTNIEGDYEPQVHISADCETTNPCFEWRPDHFFIEETQTVYLRFYQSFQDSGTYQFRIDPAEGIHGTSEAAAISINTGEQISGLAYGRYTVVGNFKLQHSFEERHSYIFTEIGGEEGFSPSFLGNDFGVTLDPNDQLRLLFGAQTYLGTYYFTLDSYPDDHSNQEQRATELTFDQPLFGVLERREDRDYFKVTLKRGHLYQFELHSLEQHPITMNHFRLERRTIDTLSSPFHVDNEARFIRFIAPENGTATFYISGKHVHAVNYQVLIKSLVLL